jgi:hypothetical protein
MSETKFTPGPWFVKRQNPSPTTGEWMIVGSKPGYLAEIRNCGSGDVQANANLIAAAPDMYDALKELCRYADDSNDCQYGTLSTRLVKDIAEAALTKARGEA